MTIEEGQREVRTVYLGGAVGGVVSGTLWLLAAALGTWGERRLAILTLVLGGALIFPVLQLVLRLMGRPASLSHDNPFRWLAMQIAFTVPLAMPVIGGASLHNVNWFFPSFMVIVGAHYLPFQFLYGMWEFLVLGAVLIGGGVWLGVNHPHHFTAGGWAGAATFYAFAAAIALRQGRAGGASRPAA